MTVEPLLSSVTPRPYPTIGDWQNPGQGSTLISGRGRLSHGGYSPMCKPAVIEDIALSLNHQLADSGAGSKCDQGTEECRFHQAHWCYLRGQRRKRLDDIAGASSSTFHVPWCATGDPLDSLRARLVKVLLISIVR